MQSFPDMMEFVMTMGGGLDIRRMDERYVTYRGFPVMIKGKQVSTVWVVMEIEGEDEIDVEYFDEESDAMSEAMYISEQKDIDYREGKLDMSRPFTG